MINENLMAALASGNFPTFLNEFNRGPCTHETFCALEKALEEDYPKRVQLFAWAKLACDKKQDQAIVNFRHLLVVRQRSQLYLNCTLLLMEAALQHDWENVFELLNDHPLVNKEKLPTDFLLKKVVADFIKVKNFFTEKTPFLTVTFSFNYAVLVGVLCKLLAIQKVIDDLSFKKNDLLLELCAENKQDFLPGPLQQVLLSRATLYGMPLTFFNSSNQLRQFALDPVTFLRNHCAPLPLQMAIAFLKAQANAYQIEENIKKENYNIYITHMDPRLSIFPLLQQIMEDYNTDFTYCLITHFRNVLKACASFEECQFLYESLTYLNKENALKIVTGDNTFFTKERALCYQSFIESFKKLYLVPVDSSPLSQQKRDFSEAAIYDLSSWQETFAPIYQQYLPIRNTLQRPLVPYWGCIIKRIDKEWRENVSIAPTVSVQVNLLAEKEEDDSASEGEEPSSKRQCNLAQGHSPAG